MSKKVLVTGAAGAVGEPTLQELLRRGDRYEVVCFDLPNWSVKRRLRPYTDQCRIIYGDLRNPSDVARAVEGVDAVIHLAAVIPPRADREIQLAKETNADGTKNLIEALERTGEPIRLLHTSSISVYGDRLAEPWIRVDDAICPSPHDHYAETKIEGEKHVRESNLDWTIYRLSGVMSLRLGLDPLMFHMPLETWFEMVTDKDVAYALVQSLEVDGMEGKTFNVGGGPRCRTTYREYLDRHLTIFGLGESFFPEEAFAKGNFHCGHYRDSEELDEYVSFMREGLDEWFERVKKDQSPLIPPLCRVLRPVIRFALLRLSEPLAARRKGDPESLERYCLE